MLPSSPVLVNLTSLVTPVVNETDCVIFLTHQIEKSFAKTFADFFYINEVRVANVSVEFMEQRNISSHAEIISELTYATIYMINNSYLKPQDMPNYKELYQLIYKLDQEKEIYDFKVRVNHYLL